MNLTLFFRLTKNRRPGICSYEKVPIIPGEATLPLDMKSNRSHKKYVNLKGYISGKVNLLILRKVHPNEYLVTNPDLIT